MATRVCRFALRSCHRQPSHTITGVHLPASCGFALFQHLGRSCVPRGKDGRVSGPLPKQGESSFQFARRKRADPFCAARLLRKRRTLGRRRTSAHRGARIISCGVGRWCGNHFPCNRRSTSLELMGKSVTASIVMDVSDPTGGVHPTHKLLDVVSLDGFRDPFQNAVELFAEAGYPGLFSDTRERETRTNHQGVSPQHGVCRSTRYGSTTTPSWRLFPFPPFKSSPGILWPKSRLPPFSERRLVSSKFGSAVAVSSQRPRRHSHVLETAGNGSCSSVRSCRSAPPAAHTCYLSANAGEHLVPRSQPGPSDLGRTVPSSRHSAVVVVPEKVKKQYESQSFLNARR